MKAADPHIFQLAPWANPNPCIGCKQFVKSPPFEIEGLSCIGGCAATVRVGDDDSGRVYAHHLPPCLVWRHE